MVASLPLSIFNTSRSNPRRLLVLEKETPPKISVSVFAVFSFTMYKDLATAKIHNNMAPQKLALLTKPDFVFQCPNKDHVTAGIYNKRVLHGSDKRSGRWLRYLKEQTQAGR